MSEKLVNGTAVTENNLNHFEEVEVPVPWGHITGKWWGPRNTQPVIAIHGWQDNCGTFDPLAPLLRQQGITLFCIDLPGHGFSSPLPRGQHYYLWWDGVLFLRRIIQHFKWDYVTLLGHSLGGGIAFLYAAAYPKEVAKYISIDIASPSVRNIRTMCKAMGPALDKFLSYEQKNMNELPGYSYEEALNTLMEAHNGSVSREGCEILLKRGAIQTEKGYKFTRDPRLKVSLLGFFSMEHVLALAEQVKCEVMNIRATQSYKMDHPEFYDITLDAIEKHAQKMERHLVEGTHHLHLNDPHSVANIIGTFVTSNLSEVV